jgi:hypothetical protein
LIGLRTDPLPLELGETTMLRSEPKKPDELRDFVIGVGSLKDFKSTDLLVHYISMIFLPEPTLWIFDCNEWWFPLISGARGRS